MQRLYKYKCKCTMAPKSMLHWLTLEQEMRNGGVAGRWDDPNCESLKCQLKWINIYKCICISVCAFAGVGVPMLAAAIILNFRIWKMISLTIVWLHKNTHKRKQQTHVCSYVCVCVYARCRLKVCFGLCFKIMSARLAAWVRGSKCLTLAECYENK